MSKDLIRGLQSTGSYKALLDDSPIHPVERKKRVFIMGPKRKKNPPCIHHVLADERAQFGFAADFICSAVMEN
jgi:hypothetical protein